MTAASQRPGTLSLQGSAFGASEMLRSLLRDAEAERRKVAQEAGAVPPELERLCENLAEAHLLLLAAAARPPA